MTESPKQETGKHKLWQWIKFTLFSASAGIIQIGTFALFNEALHWEKWVAYLVSLVLSVLWNFTFNRRYTFRSTANVPRAMLLVALYYAVFAPLSTWWTDALNAAGWNAYVVEIGTMLVNFVTEFFFQRYVVYRNDVDTNDVAKRAAEREHEQAKQD